MKSKIHHAPLTVLVIALMSSGAMARPLLAPAPVEARAVPAAGVMPVKGLLCGGGWHYSFYSFKCIRNRHRCPAGKHWISLIKTCV